MIVCEVCWVEMNHQTVYREHLASKIHLNNILFKEEISSNKPKMPFYCETCSIYTNTESVLRCHSSSIGHKTKLDLKSKLDLNNNNLISSNSLDIQTLPKIPISYSCITFSESNIQNQMPDEIDKVNYETKWCHICFVEYTSETLQNNHLNGKEHKKKLLLKKTHQPDDLFCAYCCQKHLQLDLFIDHLKSKNHLVQIKRYETYLKANNTFKYATLIDSFSNRYTSSNQSNNYLKELVHVNSF